ncbi:ovarian-specific serine/threonine-protein kinase Lok-like [Culicoides brevitarsis]|uniref:ovarian-specific serine/threonine-protein kinase Lok-like n=1 Tax=Culicoides brevitarsis TaxID=469753 RepID=UPI00307CAD77
MMEALDDIADTQENTQNHTENTQELVESQPVLDKDPWGRLFKKRILRKRLGQTATKTVLEAGGLLDYFDIRGNQFNFGRDPKTCQYVCGKDEGLDLKSWNRISKVHFMMYRESLDPTSPILLRDLSRNGTYINGELVGQNQTRLVKNGDFIAIIEPHLKIFQFKDMIVRPSVDLPHDIQSKYFVGKKLGSGAFGQVYKIMDRKMRIYAVKYIKGCSLGSNLQNSNVTDNEIRIMKKLNHLCIIKTYDIMRDLNGGASLVLEFMEGGDLLNRIINSPNRRLSEDQGRFVLYQVTAAVSYLHSKGITHRDIKPDNVLLKDRSEWSVVKLTDFGLSKIVTETSVMKSLIGTPNYVAPEVLNADQFNRYTNKVDVWSMGVMLFAMISGTLPFSEDYGDIRKQITAGKYTFFPDSWRGISQDAVMLVRNMLKVQPEARINLHEILETPWMESTHEGVQRAQLILDQGGSNVSRIRNTFQDVHLGKENGFARPLPPSKRPRYNL